jgi:hypothetical protein
VSRLAWDIYQAAFHQPPGAGKLILVVVVVEELKLEQSCGVEKQTPVAQRTHAYSYIDAQKKTKEEDDDFVNSAL